MGKNLQFSIIIPVYMAEQYLQECVESVLLQDNPDFEIILIDDGSPDECPQLCDKLAKKDTRISVIHKENEGVSAARKDGVDYSCGEYIVCIDADDLIKQGLLSAATRIISGEHPDMIYYGAIMEQSNSSDKLLYREGYYSRKEIEEKIFPRLIHADNAEYFAPGVWGKIIKRRLFQDNLICDKRAMMGEDGASVIPCIYQASSLYIMNDKYYYYRYVSSSVTKGRKVINWDCPKIVNKHIISKININEFDFKDQMYRKVAHDFFNTACTQFYRQSAYIEIKKDILEHMGEDFYKTAIENAKFSHSIRAAIMMIMLKYKIIFMIYICSRIRK